jgi:transposase
VSVGPTTRHVSRLAIKTLLERGDSASAIVKATGRSLSTVKRWIRKWKEAKREGIPDHIAVMDKPHSGKPPTITPSIGKAILRFAEGKVNRPASAIRAHIQLKFGVTLTTRRIQQWMREKGLNPYHRDKQLKLSAEHRRKRVVFARNWLNHDWTNTLFTDETEFLLDPKTINTKDNIVWARSKDDVPPIEVDQYSQKFQVWGGIAAKGRTRLIFYEGGLDAAQYRDKVLAKALPDFSVIFGAGNRSWTFVHDGASAHKAATTNTWLTAHVPHFIPSGPTGEWPAKSPDLNIIEQLWGQMKLDIELNKPKSMEALKTRIKTLWANLDLDTVTKQAEGMQKRLKLIIGTGGAITPN